MLGCSEDDGEWEAHMKACTYLHGNMDTHMATSDPIDSLAATNGNEVATETHCREHKI